MSANDLGPTTTPREERPFQGDEATTLCWFLDEHRAVLRLKCADLSADQLARPLPPSDMTLGGMLKHLAFVEFWWFEAVALGAPTSEPWVSVDWAADEDWDWHSAAEDSAADLRALWEGQVERSRQAVQELLAADGDPLGRVLESYDGRRRVTLRWILTHMIEEYARHNGHADLLREQIDGQTGE